MQTEIIFEHDYHLTVGYLVVITSLNILLQYPSYT